MSHTFTSQFGCPFGNPHCGGLHQQIVPAYTPPPPGCICPPGANHACENPACPRKPQLTGAR